ERADEVLAALERLHYKVYCDRRDDPQLDRTKVNWATADKLRERMRTCKMLLFVATTGSAESVWVPWELGFFDAVRGNIVVYPVDKDAEDAARNQQYLSLYEVISAGSLEREIAERLKSAAGEGAAGVEGAMQQMAQQGEALVALGRHAVENM